MATILRQAPFPLLPLVEEAIAALGYFQPEYAGELAAIYEGLWPRGVSGSMLSDAPVAHMLSDKGRADEGHACAATTMRIVFNLRRAEFERSEPHWGGPGAQVRLWARGNPCKAMLGHDQRVFPWAESPMLPQPGCDREWCPCLYTVEFEP